MIKVEGIHHSALLKPLVAKSKRKKNVYKQNAGGGIHQERVKC